MIRRPPRSTLDRSSAASDVYKRQALAVSPQDEEGLPVQWEQLGKQYEVELVVCIATAVSYTHLRAHETVLDLVCRLLLEKKKTKEYEVEHEMNRDNQQNYIQKK